ncbi:MAG TPA: hypothetical protein VF059_13420 [Casimicrobiaceae bacterium]
MSGFGVARVDAVADAASSRLAAYIGMPRACEEGAGPPARPRPVRLRIDRALRYDAHVLTMCMEDPVSTVTERIPVLVSRTEKAEISRKAKAAGLSMGEFLRRGAKSYRSTPPEDERLLLGLIEQMNKSTAEAGKALEDLLAYVEASNRRIDALERRARRKGER